MSVSELPGVRTHPMRVEGAPAPAEAAALAHEAEAMRRGAEARRLLMRALVFAVFAAAGLGLIWFGCAMVLREAVTVPQSLAFTLPGALMLLAGAAMALTARAEDALPAYGPRRGG